MEKKVKIAICQTAVTTDSNRNVENALAQIQTMSTEGAQIIVLPEIFHCPYDLTVLADYAVDDHSQLVEQMRQSSYDNDILLVAGTVPERDGKRLFNTCYLFDKGELLGKYRKFHLFNIDIPGKITFQESKVFSAGEQVGVFASRFGKIGVAICFDLRFPELFKTMALQGASIVFVPGAFNTVTGPLHWELSLRARAVDCQCFLAACSPALNRDLSYHAWGHSALVHPMGHVVEMLTSDPGAILAQIDLAEVEKVRCELPLLRQTRLLKTIELLHES